MLQMRVDIYNAILKLSGLIRMANWRKSDLLGPHYWCWFFFALIMSPKQNPEISRVIFFEKKIIVILSRGGITKSEIFKKHPYWGENDYQR